MELGRFILEAIRSLESSTMVYLNAKISSIGELNKSIWKLHRSLDGPWDPAYVADFSVFLTNNSLMGESTHFSLGLLAGES